LTLADEINVIEMWDPTQCIFSA